MAISTTYTKRQEELARNQQPVGSNKAYNGMSGVSQNTANNLGNYQQGYQPGQQVQQANDTLSQIQAQKPQTYNSKYGEQLDALLKQIQNPKEFKYEFNGDELFKYYADLYTQKGKQAAMDVQGQAAGLTGGYGNTYAQQVGQQKYQDYLLNLYDKGMDLRNAAYQQHRDRIGDDQTAYGLTAQADATDYARHLDEVANWQNERAYAAERADTEYNRDFSQYQQDLQYWTNMAQAEASQAQSREEFEKTDKLNWAKLEEDKRQADMTMDEKQREYNQGIAIDYVSAILANGQIPSNELLVAAGLSLEDAQKLIKKATGSGGKKKDEDNDPTNVFYVDDTSGENQYYIYQDGQRVNVPNYLVKDNDLVHNEYEEGAKRRRTNYNSANEKKITDLINKYQKKHDDD